MFRISAFAQSRPRSNAITPTSASAGLALMRTVYVLVVAIAAWLSLAAGASASCDVQKALYDQSVAICNKNKSYCGDVDIYRKDVITACGAGALPGNGTGVKNASGQGDGYGQGGNAKPGTGQSANAGGKAGQNAAGDQSDDPTDNGDNGDEDFAEPKTPPASCAYFTKPANQKVRLNYYVPSSAVCWKGSAYECQADPHGGKQWVYRAPCHVFKGLVEACKVEGTC